MSFTSVIEAMPPELQLHMFRFAEALEEKIESDLAVRRQDFNELRVAVSELTKAQAQTEQRVGELAEAQVQTEQRVGELAEAQKQTEQRVGELAEAQKQTEQRVGRMEQALTELAEAQKQTEQRVGRMEQALTELAEAQKQTEEVLKQTVRYQDGLRGDNLERNYREKISSYLGPILRKVRVIPLQEIVEELEQHLSTEELNELWPLDLLVRGQVSQVPERPEVWLAMEISYVIDRHDVTRAARRAALLRKAGYRAIPTVAGQEITEGAEAEVSREKVFLLRNGSRRFWEEAVAQRFAA